MKRKYLDVSEPRCQGDLNGVICERREDCARYAHRNDLGPVTATSSFMCYWKKDGGYVDFFIRDSVDE